jgi:RNA 2',3'-cyclic 3'-phosphodiesterase
MRLFVGVDLPEEIVDHLAGLIENLRAVAHIAWSTAANLHITTKFIGWWPDERLDAVKTALAALPPRAPIPIHIRGLGFFPNARSPRVFWCGIEAPGLDALASETDRATATLGIETEKRAFSPHLTLARIKEPTNLRPLHDAIAHLQSTDFGKTEARRFFLYQSHLSPKGSVYSKLAEFPFA